MGPFAGVDTVTLLQTGMRVAEMNQRVIANNIANADTPNYHAGRLDFDATLRAELSGRGHVGLRTTEARHIDYSRSRPEFERIAFLSKNDYNKVDLDEEIVKLSENTGRYTLFGSLLVKQFQIVKSMLNNIR